jgi:ubiquinone/menaquinone biosynthesis C-methylase UbiE
LGQNPNRYVLILYTTLYRTGGEKFKRAATTFATEKIREFPRHKIVCHAIESKNEFLAQFDAIRLDQGVVTEFHFFGHSGMYGIMFGTTKWPEQFSPFEWRQMNLPLEPGSRFYFHACRTGRWFAPFIARTLQVQTFGHFWYTTVSAHPRRFLWQKFSLNDATHIISVPGKKSHGLFGSVYKYFGFASAIPMLEFQPGVEAVDTSYNAVAELYDDTFEDISVRQDELQWLRQHLEGSTKSTVLDIGCGTGSFLRKLSPFVEQCVGVDASSGMIEQAKKRAQEFRNLEFRVITGPHLPFADNSFDKVTSVLSFRYLDWDPILAEIVRVLKPGGEFLVIDMVAAPVRWREMPLFFRDKIRQQSQKIRFPKYFLALRRMVTDPRWKKMLQYNPIRSEHEFRWYLESRFPGQKVEILNMGWNSRVLAFRSPPIHSKQIEKMVYP